MFACSDTAATEKPHWRRVSSFLTKGTDRLGKVTDGNTVCDSDPEEIRRQFSISSALAPVEYKGHKINMIDTPGYFDFAGEVMQGLRVANAGLILCTAKNGVEVGTEKSWKYVSDRALPRMFYISKLDEEHADFVGTAAALRNAFGSSVCPIMLPIVDGGKLTGYVDIPKNKAFAFDGKAYAECPIPGDVADQVEEYRMGADRGRCGDRRRAHGKVLCRRAFLPRRSM